MSPQDIAQIISSVGFPIVSACGLFWYMIKEGRENREVVDNNTLVLTKILEHIKDEENKK